MSLRLEMLQVARLAPVILGEEATDLIKSFIWDQRCPESGGFADRDQTADLYYTSFAVDALTAIAEPLPEEALERFLNAQFAKIEELDFVHLCCFARIASALSNTRDLDLVFEKIECYRTDDGGYNQTVNSKTGSAYASFLAFGAYSDHRRPVVNSDGVIESLNGLQQLSGGWANDTFLPVENVPATAAAITVYRNLQAPIPAQTAVWLDSCYQKASGGFLPFPGAPLADLLSTAVALHALDGLQAEIKSKKERTLDFIDSLWTNEGGFHGSWEDDDLDIEYTYYGLLALGHLAL